MPISGPSASPFPTAFLPDASSADLVGVSTSDAKPYKTNIRSNREQSPISFVQLERLTGFSGLRYGSQLAQAQAAGAVQLAFDVDDFLEFELTGNTTFQWSGAPLVHARYAVLLVQDAVGGRTVTWPAGVLWNGGIAPVITPAAGAVSLIEFVGMNNPVTFAWGLYGFARLNQL